MKKLINIKDLLSREEMRAITGGCGGYPGGGGNGNRCNSNADCAGSAICCGPPGGATYCQNCPCDQKCD